MAYPPPPGLSNTPTSLPARPPPPASKPSAKSKDSASPFTAFAPRTVSTVSTVQQPYRTDNSVSSANYNNTYQQNGYYGGAQADYNGQYQPEAAPQIKNPFLPANTAAEAAMRGFGAADPELEAQMAQWQSAYNSKDEKRVFQNTYNTAPRDNLSAQELSSAANARSDVASVLVGSDGKQKTVVRKGGGQTWQDPSLLEWDPAHFRLFVGNLAGEVTDESLIKAFSKYTSIQKARVIRDKRSTKSKGFGFVSFSDGDEYFRAAKEMQGKYIGSHPILLRKSTTEIKAVTPKEQKKRRYAKDNGERESDRTGAGVRKKEGNKTKGGLKIIG